MNIVLIGETGSGKTSMLNLLANACAEADLSNFRYYHSSENEKGGSLACSQTSKPKLYRIECVGGQEVQILDTPGFADTHGVDKDNENKAAIANAIKGLETVDAIIVLTNGTVPRLSTTTEYTLSIVSSLFPHSIVNNIFIIFTMVATPDLLNFELDILPVQLREAQYWCIDNPFSQWSKFKQNSIPNNDVRMKGVSDRYMVCLETLSNAFEKFDDCVSQPTREIYQLFTVSMEIESAISNVIARLNQLEDTRSQFRMLQQMIASQEQVNEIYQRIADPSYYEQQPTPKVYNTICLVPSCYTNCHQACGVKFIFTRSSLNTNCRVFGKNDKRSALSRWAARLFVSQDAARGKTCQICSHKAKDHARYASIWIRSPKKASVIDPETKKQYEKGRMEVENNKVRLPEFEEEIAGLNKDIIDQETMLLTLCDRYEGLALSGSFVAHISSAINLLKMREKTSKNVGDVEASQHLQVQIERLEAKKQVLQQAVMGKKEPKLRAFGLRAANP